MAMHKPSNKTRHLTTIVGYDIVSAEQYADNNSAFLNSIKAEIGGRVMRFNKYNIVSVEEYINAVEMVGDMFNEQYELHVGYDPYRLGVVEKRLLLEYILERVDGEFIIEYEELDSETSYYNIYEVI